jgi:ATPase subunit of ABC transporter with duplicated ATPase domains
VYSIKEKSIKKMEINLTNTGKRFNLDWIFRHFNYNFSSQKSYAITGSNGSGKSTLLQIIAGAITHSEGSIVYFYNQEKIDSQKAYLNLSIASPYLELIEEMTALEFLSFHENFKPLSVEIKSILEEVGLKNATHKQIRYYSSGMKQRLKLAQAFFSKTEIILLDEPCTNLDATGIKLYQSLIEKYSQNRLVIVSSNDLNEYEFCSERISIEDYK